MTIMLQWQQCCQQHIHAVRLSCWQQQRKYKTGAINRGAGASKATVVQMGEDVMTTAM